MKYALLIGFVVLSGMTVAQDAAKPRPSPLAMATGRYKDTYIKVTYSQPHKKGREIFGALVPYGQVWRTGANEATEITVSRDILINDLELKAGTYTLFTIPRKDSWTILINKDAGLWGSYNYNATMDLLKFDVPVIEANELVYEAFTILIDPKNSKADLVLAWDRIKVIVPLQFQEPTP